MLRPVYPAISSTSLLKAPATRSASSPRTRWPRRSYAASRCARCRPPGYSTPASASDVTRASSAAWMDDVPVLGRPTCRWTSAINAPGPLERPAPRPSETCHLPARPHGCQPRAGGGPRRGAPVLIGSGILRPRSGLLPQASGAADAVIGLDARRLPRCQLIRKHWDVNDQAEPRAGLCLRESRVLTRPTVARASAGLVGARLAGMTHARCARIAA